MQRTRSVGGDSHPVAQPVVVRARCVFRRLVPHFFIGRWVESEAPGIIALVLRGFLVLHGAAAGDRQRQRPVRPGEHEAGQVPVLIPEVHASVLPGRQGGF